MPATNLDLFDSVPPTDLKAYLEAFETWALWRGERGDLRERSSVAVYRSMWGALTAWCSSRGLVLNTLPAADLEAFLLSRGGTADLTPRHAWRLLMLVDEVLAHHARTQNLPRNESAQRLLVSRPEWRYANANDKTPLPEHLHADEARRLVDWLLDPAGPQPPATATAQPWQSLRNRSSVGLQLGAGLTPGDIRLARLDAVVARAGPAGLLPWKISLPAHGGAPAREAPIAPWAGRLLRSWLEARQTVQMAGPMLFPATSSGRPWGKVAQYMAAKSVLTDAGLQDTEGGSFKLRHTFALRQLKRGTPPERVAEWMGLSDTAALARYRRVLMTPPEIV
ncbi:MAG: site-specific integrase [Microbacteriaceae bacterium]|nr:site-specific integrase [Burkholderiaceae bacterium]